MLSRARRDIVVRSAVLWVVAMIALSALACLSIGGAQTLPAGEGAPDFNWQVGDRESALSDYQGSVVMIIFWSST